jgi:hypothetical protein
MEIFSSLCKSAGALWKYITIHPLELAGLILAYFALVVPIRQYLGQKRLEEKDKRFTNYHTLVKDIVGADGNVFIDRQIAAVFELRNYSEYYDVTERILMGLRRTWIESNIPAERLIMEIDLTVDFIHNRRSRVLYRLKTRLKAYF